MKLIIIIVNTENIMFYSFLVSSLGFFKHGYPTQNMETGNSEWRIVIWFSAFVIDNNSKTYVLNKYDIFAIYVTTLEY